MVQTTDPVDRISTANDADPTSPPGRCPLGDRGPGVLGASGAAGEPFPSLKPMNLRDTIRRLQDNAHARRGL